MDASIITPCTGRIVLCVNLRGLRFLLVHHSLYARIGTSNRPPFEFIAKFLCRPQSPFTLRSLSVTMRRLCLSFGRRQNQALSLGLAELDEPSASPGNSYFARRRQRGGMGNVIFEKGCQAFGRRSIIRVFPQGTRKPILSVPKAFPYMFAFALASVQNPVPDVVSTQILSRNVRKHSGGPAGRRVLFWTSTL